jgi:hypothetical protein
MIMANVNLKHEPLIDARYYARFRIYDTNDIPGAFTPSSSEHGFSTQECGNDLVDVMQAFIDKFPKSPRKRSLSM